MTVVKDELKPLKVLSQVEKAHSDTVSVKNDSLISPKTISFPTQRLVATSLFVLLQGCKIISSKSSSSFVLYSTLDVVFVFLLPLFSIPWLHFKFFGVVLQCLVLLVFNYSLFIDGRWVYHFLLALMQPIFALFSKGDPKPHNLLTGKYTVDLLPEATASLDKLGQLCLDVDSQKPVAIRLKVNLTYPSSIKLGKRDLNSGNVEHLVFNKMDISDFPQDGKTEVFIPVSSPGSYFLESITDGETGMRVNIDRSAVTIPPCPKAEIRLDSYQPVCSGSEINAEISVEGVAPLAIVFKGEEITLGEFNTNYTVGRYTHRIKNIADSSGEDISFSIDSVVDALGSSIKASPAPAYVHVNAIPTGYVPSQKLALDSERGVPVSLVVTGEDGPFTAIFDGPNGEFQKQFDSEGRHTMFVGDVGMYSFKQLNGAQCAGVASGTFEVFNPPPVGVVVEFETVEDRCAGPVAVDAHLKFSGTGPWVVGAQTFIKSQIVKRQRLEFNEAESPENVIHFRPDNVGDYTYEITYVQDSYFHQMLESRTEQSIKDLPGAWFTKNIKRAYCKNDQASVDVKVRGHGPFTLTYSVDDIQTFNKTVSGDGDDDISLYLDIGSGSHFVRLLSMTDKNNCVIDLGSARTPDIVVQRSTSHISLLNPGEYKSTEPVNMVLPLNGVGLEIYPATLVYEHVDLSGTIHEHTLRINSDNDLKIHVEAAGVYRLVSLDDHVCGGTVDNESIAAISLYNRPKITFSDSDPVLSLCQNSNPLVVNFNLDGESPFVVTHEVVDPTGKSITKNTQIDGYQFNTLLDAKLKGQYTHYLWLTDSQYKKVERMQYLKFQHNVSASAEAQFISKQSHYESCEMALFDQSLPVLLSGDGPFELTVQVGNDVKVIEIPYGSTLDLKNEISLLESGGQNIKVQLLSVSDKNGCRATVPSESGTIEINVLSRPEVLELTKRDYCVGDTVSFEIHGRGSTYNVQYRENDKVYDESVTLDRNKRKFSLSAKSEGVLSLLSVTDLQGCSQNTDVTAVVHRLPSSKITEQPHFSIYDGDKINLGFAFEGTAPFSFVYIHTINGKEVERKEIRDINEYEYTISVDQEGEYEIIELKDKFCRSVRY